jgi:hypothetical protein
MTRSAEILERLLDDLEDTLDRTNLFVRGHPLYVMIREDVETARADWMRAKLIGLHDHNPSPRGDQSRPAPGP